MKILKKLENSRSFWSILIISLLFFFLRLPSIIEPYWYGDEGIYEVIGQAIHQGRALYTDIWDNKPPLLYIIFAFFNGNQESVRTLSLIFGLLSTIVFFYFCQKLFRKLSSSVIATLLFVLLFATPFLEGNIANAENFMLLPILIAGLLIYNHSSTRHSGLNGSRHSKMTDRPIKLFLAGFLLSIAFLFKIVAIFDLIAFILFMLLSSLREEKRRSNLIQQIAGITSAARNDILSVIAGFALTCLITILYFLSQHALKDFIEAAFFGNVDYVGLNNSFLNIPQGLLFFKILLLATVLSLIYFKRHKLSKPILFILLWFSFSFFNAFFSQRPYTHYLLVLLPSICLFIGLFFETSKNKFRFLLLACLISMFALIKNNFWMTNPKDTALYYQNMMLFITGHKDVQSYRSFFDIRTPRDYELASFITKHTTESDTIFIWGDSAQIYALSNKLPIDKYTVAYHITQNKELMKETQQTLIEVKPKYIITLSETPPLPFNVPFYTIRFNYTGATIYERTF
jgi:hypothetical protein